MSKPRDHLVHTASLEAGRLALAKLTGLSRLNIDLHRLSATAQLSMPAGAERFLYVLEGSGSLRAHSAGANTTAALGTGDFVALTAAEVAELSTDPGITILLGQSGVPPIA